MEYILTFLRSKESVKSILLDITALAFIYFVPTISHMLNVPLYLLEPMRIMLILSMAHSGRINNFLIALTLPLFSLLISTHPSMEKTILITSELLLNVWLYYEFSKKFNAFNSALMSILIGKVFYYVVKFAFISLALLDSELISTPVYLQVITTLVLSAYIHFITVAKEKRTRKPETNN
ncbi:MAG: hypothetical protein ACM3S2_17335 [Ignavibacteriales bacterium]